ncbi:hypothetical protein KFK09_000813 [Dendrobium nobile]|uniref:Uncharacterized protein n=1 Tax=Dendrobium nobile TaxID=94219 RepID=A0A8T3CFZ9_DENNO|nr:hypothetical protein KFK09_000813 [Dendrobium nobile]
MNSVFSTFRCKVRFFPANFRFFCTIPLDSRHTRQNVRCRKSAVLDGTSRVRVRVRINNAELKENWLDSLSCPFFEMGGLPVEETEQLERVSSPEWIVGVDPDVSGALALLKEDSSGCIAQVFDTPYLQVLVGKRTRKRIDARSIVQLLHSIGAPPGTRAYIEQSTPFPQDGKQGWWSGGFTYGLWIGILVASGFSVVPITSRLWKDQFQLCGSSYSKDDSRKTASILFPSMSSFLKRKKDHGRAEALLIAACGKGLKLKAEANIASDYDLKD